MTITIIIISAVIVFIVGYTFGAVNNTEPLPKCCADCLHTHNHGGLYSPFYNDSKCCNHFGLSSLRSELSAAVCEIRRLSCENQNLKMESSYYRNSPLDKVWFKEVGDKEKAAAKLKEALKPLEELKSQLN